MRPAATGLATAFFRLYLLEALATAPARPATLLAKIAAEELPLASGGFSRALQALLEGGYLVPAPEGAVALTALGANERVAERERWQRVIPTATRLAGESAALPRGEPVIAEAGPVACRATRVADGYLDRVLLAALRERLANARDGGSAFALALGIAEVDTTSEAARRAIVHRLIRATIGATTTVFGGDANAYRYGDAGIALVAPATAGSDRGGILVALLRTRMTELLAAMTTTVRAFKGTRWEVRCGGATWTGAIHTSGDLLRIAQDELASDGMAARAA